MQSLWIDKNGRVKLLFVKTNNFPSKTIFSATPPEHPKTGILRRSIHDHFCG